MNRYHENCRIFQDRLVNDEDRTWFKKLLEEKLVDSFQMRFDEVVTRTPLFYGDFMIPSAEVKLYNEITNEEKVCINGTKFSCPRLKLNFYPTIPTGYTSLLI